MSPRIELLVTCSFLLAATTLCHAALAGQPMRNDWYWDSVVSLHIDNHSRLVGKGYSVEQLTEMVKDIPVAMIQVSAFGAAGVTTYPTDICAHPNRGDWDTLGTWRQVARNLHRRFCVYINTRGLALTKDNPDWMQRDARGRGKGRNDGLDVCARPSADGSGVLEKVLLPMLKEIVTRYRPDGIWVDGDHARTHVCYCRNCKAAWQAATGKGEPPKNPEYPGWPEWLALEQRRFDEYRERMAHVIHSIHDGCMYTSNHSWRFRSKDPRCAPEFADTLSGDLSHGSALRATRLCAMQVSPEERAPYDIMHNISRISRQPASLPRVLQQGALTLASGGAWFLWSPGSTIVRQAMQQRAKACAEFAAARRAALGRSASLNQTAVLLSETSWRQERIAGKQDYYDPKAPEHAALALQDACYGVDMINEEMLCARIRGYRTVFVVNQRRLDPRTMSQLRAFVREGGLLVVAGSGLREELDRENPAASELLGMARGNEVRGGHRIDVGDSTFVLQSAWDIQSGPAEVIARFSNGKPCLTRNRMGKGAAAYLAASDMAYPDEGLLAWVMKTLGNGPAVHVEGAARDEHLVFSLRGKPGQIILHVTDLASRVGGKRIVPTTQNNIDDDPPLPEVKLSLPLASPPKRVECVPAQTTASHRWEKGVLHLALRDFDLHAAVILDVPPHTRTAYMPATTPAAKPHMQDPTIEENFESLSVREPVPESLGRCRAEGKTSIRVTARTAASGRRCLKFVDDPDAPQPFHPYFHLRPRGLHRDVGHFSFDLRLEEDADVQVELREVENARRFPVGPSLRFSGKGELRSAGARDPIAHVPTDEWFHADILFPLDRGGRYELRLRVPGKGQRIFADLPYRSREFWRCGWIGIIGTGKAEAAFYVDNLRVGRTKTKADFDRLDLAKIETMSARQARIVKEEGLCAFWALDEGKGHIAVDGSGRGNHGDVGAQWANGKLGSSLFFSGKKGANVLVEDCEDFRFGTSDFTIICWVQPRSLDSPKKYRRLMDKNRFPHTWWNIDVLSDGRVEMEMVDENRQKGSSVSRGSIPLNAWSHVAVVVDRRNFKTTFYFNGKIDAANEMPRSFAGALDARGADLYIGGSHLPFIGSIDEVRVYTRALPEKDIRAKYASTKP